jgi:sugar-specific transcriptional regulator TrmB
MNEEIKKELRALGFSDNEANVYFASTQLGEATAAEIAKKAGLPRTTAISILSKMKEDGYLTVHKYRGALYYWIESPKVIGEIFRQKTEIAEHLSGFFTDLYRSEANFPFAEIYDTKASIRKFIEKTLSKYPLKGQLRTIDSPGSGNYNKIFPEDIGNIILGYKKKRRLTTKTLVPFGFHKTIAEHKIKSQEIEIRELPPGISFKASLWVLNDRLVFFSGNPPFVVVIEHEAIYSSFKEIFDHFWNLSIS